MWETLRKEEVIKLLKTDRKNGITEEETKERERKYGTNQLKDKPKETLQVENYYID